MNYIFIDESGDSGFKFKRGSTRYFVIGMIFFDDDIKVEEVNLAIKKLRRQLKIPDGFEFKFSKTKTKYRSDFFTAIRLFKFGYFILMIDKKAIDISTYQDSKLRFYDFIFQKFFLIHKTYFQKRSTIYLDKRLNSMLIRSFNTMVRKIIKDKKEKARLKIKHVRSRSNNLIQLIDMIVGAIFHKFERKDSRYYNQIKIREKKLINVPR